MAKQLFVKQQSPVVSVKVSCRPDVAGEISSIIIGFRRYPTDKITAIYEAFQEAAKAGADELNVFLKTQILFIQKADVDVYDVDGDVNTFIETISIDDSRTAKPVDSFWGTAEECLSVLVDYYLLSTPWKDSFIRTFSSVLMNKEFKEDEIKN